MLAVNREHYITRMQALKLDSLLLHPLLNLFSALMPYGQQQLPLLSGRVDMKELSFAYRDENIYCVILTCR